MIFSNGEQEHEILGVYSVSYPGELADGVLIDMEGCYAFLSDHIEGHREAMEDICDEDTQHYDLTECEIDWDVAPHLWVMKSLGKIVVASAEGMLDQG